jgi:L-rhamnose mutarotase
MKRFCQMLELVNDKELIEKYVEVHAHVWPEVMAGQHEVGILDMQIYRLGNKVFMICDTVDEFDWQRDMARLAKLPRQAEWEAYVAQYQGYDPSAPSASKWHLMDKIFQLE